MNKILLVRLGAMGDLIHALPAAAALRRHLPDARIDWLVDVRHHEVLDLVPIVNRRISIDTTAVGAVLGIVRQLRSERYDVVLDLQGLVKSAVLARLSGAVRVVGFERALLREPMAGMLYTETGGSDAAHVIRKNLSLLRTLGIQSSTLEFPLENRRPQIADDVRRRLGISETDRFAIINPGAAWPNKRWPPVYFAEVAVALKARQGLPSVVMWGPGEEQLAQTVVDASQGSAAISPRTTIADLVSLTRAASLMVSGDTGPLHIAGAMGTPIVGIYGPTNPARNGPWAASDMWISQFQNCECQYRRQCHAQRWCMLEISPRDVNDVIDRSLSTPPSRGHAGRG